MHVALYDHGATVAPVQSQLIWMMRLVPFSFACEVLAFFLTIIDTEVSSNSKYVFGPSHYCTTLTLSDAQSSTLRGMYVCK